MKMNRKCVLQMLGNLSRNSHKVNLIKIKKM